MTTSTWVPIRNKILSIGKFFIPVVSAAAGLFGGGLPKGVLVVLKGLPSLMAIAEEAAPPGSGPAKKQAVMDAADKLLALIGPEFTGGAAENFDKYKDTIGLAIDGLISAVNAVDKGLVADDKTPIDAP